jgi:hypothetical protein
VTFNLLPAGLLFRTQTGPTRSATHVLGTGLSRSQPTGQGAGKSQFRLLGIPIWSSHPAKAPVQSAQLRAL